MIYSLVAILRLGVTMTHGLYPKLGSPEAEPEFKGFIRGVLSGVGE